MLRWLIVPVLVIPFLGSKPIGEGITTPADYLVSTNSVPLTDSVTPPLLGSSIAYGVDSSVSPCDDFYEYANGGWRKAVVFPESWLPRRRTWTHFDQSSVTTRARIERVIDSAYRSIGTTNNSALNAIGLFYSSCIEADSLEMVIPKRVKKDTAVKDSTRAAQCVQRVMRYLGDATGQAFTEQYLTERAMERMEVLLSLLKTAAHERVAKQPFMNASELSDMQKRLDKLYLRVAIPDTKIDFSTLSLSRSDYQKNKDAIANFNTQRSVKTIGGDIRELWKMSVFTPNAMYLPMEHAVEIPTAMFMSPFFDVTADDAQNFASVGYVIGHEMFHSLSSHLDVLENQTVKAAIDSFKAGNTRLGTVDGWAARGTTTYPEDIADLGGIRTAYAAWKMANAKQQHLNSQRIDGFTPEQRFFLSFGRVWRAKWVEQSAQNQDVHAAYFARVNGMVMQMPEFAAAFGCKSGDRMVLPADKISRLW